MDWKHLLASITGTVDQELLLRNEYLVTETRILRNQITGRVRLTDGERKTLAEIGQKLGKQALAEVAKIVTPDTILAWHRKQIAQKFDGSPQRPSPGRPRIDAALEALIVRMAQENRSWGYDRIVGALKHLGYTIRPTVSPLMIPLIYCHIKSFQRTSSVEKPWPGGEKRTTVWASHPVEW